MRRSLGALGAVAILGAAVVASARLPAAPAAGSGLAKAPSPFVPAPPFAPPREIVLFGHVRSLARKDARFELRVDPAEYLSGETANRAAVEDGVIPPGDVVPNDHYVRDPEHRLLTYLVPASAHVTVVTHRRGQVGATVVTVSELARIVRGENPKHRALFEPRNGFWLRVATDTVRSLDQQ